MYSSPLVLERHGAFQALLDHDWRLLVVLVPFPAHSGLYDDNIFLSYTVCLWRCCFALFKWDLFCWCFQFQSPVKNGAPSLLSSFSSSTTSGSSSSSSLVSMASVVGGITTVPTSSSLIGSFSSAVQQHQHQLTQQQQQSQSLSQSQQQQQQSQTKPSIPSNNTPSPPNNPLIPMSTAPSLPTPSTLSSSAPTSQSTAGPTTTSSLGLGLGLDLRKGTSSANQMSSLGLGGHPTPLSTMAGLISGSTLAPYAQAAASGGLGLSSTTQSSNSVESSTSISTSGSSGVTTNGAGTGLGLSCPSSSHNSMSGSILGLVSGQGVTSGASQVPPSSASSTTGAVSMLGGNGGNVGVVGMNAAPARPPSGLKQNGSTSELMWLLCVIFFYPFFLHFSLFKDVFVPLPLTYSQVTVLLWPRAPQNRL